MNDIARIGFIGTGLMGTAMVLHRLLAAGFRVRVWNRSTENLNSLIAAGAQAATSAADAANAMDAVFLCLSNSAAVESVMFAEEGIARAPLVPLWRRGAEGLSSCGRARFSAQRSVGID
jgi:3-hydroxyisobutyrate dehydrogenase-like beta-hydroxyacid dehydrogenase